MYRKRTLKSFLALVVAMGMLAAGIAAQAAPRGGKEARGGGRPQRGQMSILRFMAHPAVNTDVQQLDNGISILLTSAEEKVVERLRAAVRERTDELRGLAGGRKRAAVAEKVDVNVMDVDGGVEITISSDDERVAQVLKKRLGHRLEAIKEKARIGRLMKSDKIDVDVEKTDEGVVVRVTSEDPDVVEMIHQHAEERLARWQKMRERMKERRERGPGARRGGRRKDRQDDE